MDDNAGGCNEGFGCEGGVCSDNTPPEPVNAAALTYSPSYVKDSGITLTGVKFTDDVATQLLHVIMYEIDSSSTLLYSATKPISESISRYWDPCPNNDGKKVIFKYYVYDEEENLFSYIAPSTGICCNDNKAWWQSASKCYWMITGSQTSCTLSSDCNRIVGDICSNGKCCPLGTVWDGATCATATTNNDPITCVGSGGSWHDDVPADAWHSGNPSCVGDQSNEYYCVKKLGAQVEPEGTS